MPYGPSGGGGSASSSVYATAGLSVDQGIPYATITKITFNTDILDPSGIFNTVLNRFIPATLGAYAIFVTALNIYYAEDYGQYYEYWIYLNGIAYNHFQDSMLGDPVTSAAPGTTSPVSLYPGFSFGTIVPVTAVTDYIEIFTRFSNIGLGAAPGGIFSGGTVFNGWKI